MNAYPSISGAIIAIFDKKHGRGLTTAPATVPDDLVKYVKQNIRDSAIGEDLSDVDIVRSALWAACSHPDQCKNPHPHRCDAITAAYVAGAQAYLGLYRPEPGELAEAQEAARRRWANDRDEEEVPVDHADVRRALAVSQLNKRIPGQALGSRKGYEKRHQFAEHLELALGCIAAQDSFDEVLVCAYAETVEFDQARVMSQEVSDAAEAIIEEDASSGSVAIGPETTFETSPEDITPDEPVPPCVPPADPVPPNEPPRFVGDVPNTKKRFWTRRRLLAGLATFLLVAATLAWVPWPGPSAEVSLIQVTAVETEALGLGYWVPADADFSDYPYDSVSDMCPTAKDHDWIDRNGGEVQNDYMAYEIRNISDSPLRVSLQNIHLEEDSTTTAAEQPGLFINCYGLEGGVETIDAQFRLDEGDETARVSYADGPAPLGPTFYTLEPGEVVNLTVSLIISKYDFEGRVVLEATQGKDKVQSVVLAALNGDETIRLRGGGDRFLSVLFPYIDPDATNVPRCHAYTGNPDDPPFDSFDPQFECTRSDIQTLLHNVWEDS